MKHGALQSDIIRKLRRLTQVFLIFPLCNSASLFLLEETVL